VSLYGRLNEFTNGTITVLLQVVTFMIQHGAVIAYYKKADPLSEARRKL
jgi:hypothetical protein